MGAASGAGCHGCQPCCENNAKCDLALIKKTVGAPPPRSLDGKALVACCPEDVSTDEAAVQDYQLLSASAGGDLEMIRASLENGADIEARRPLVFREGGPLVVNDNGASVDDDLDFQEVLVLEDQGVFQTRGFGITEATTVEKERDHGLTPLMRAAKEGRVQAVALLIVKRASPHTRDEAGKTPLHFAAAAGCRSTCQTLLRSGANRLILDNEHRDPFMVVPREFMSSARERVQWETLLKPA